MMRPHAWVAVSAYSVALLAGCGDGKSPVQPSTDPYASLFPAFALSGRVVDTAYRPIAGVSVAIVAGPRTGTVEITGEDGRFAMEGIFTNPVTVRASKDGYQPETRILPPPNVPATLVEGGMWDVQLYLAPSGPLPDLAGTYTMRISADNACTNFPDHSRTRQYTATVVPGGRPGFFHGTLSDARFAPVVPCPPVSTGLSCTHNNIGIGNAGDYTWMGFSIIEQFGDHTYLVVSAGASGSFGPAGGTAPLKGFLQYCETEPTQIDQGLWWCPTGPENTCESDHHQLTLVRR